MTVETLSRPNSGSDVTLVVTCLDLTSFHIEAAVCKCCDILGPEGKALEQILVKLR